MSGEPIGIIYPPPELRSKYAAVQLSFVLISRLFRLDIVDKTASFVARNGPEFESRIQQNEQNNPKFNFLKPGDPYNGYYQHKVKEIREGSGKPEETSAPPSTIQTAVQQTTTPGLSLKSAKQLESLLEAPIIIRDPPPEFEFSAEPPSLSAIDLDVVKLTAQFVAIHGRAFLTNLMSREQRNYQFDFLRPQHGLFSYFTQLIEQYTKVLMPPKNLINDLKKESENQKVVMEKVRYRLEWTKIQEAERRREEEEAERERVQYAQIDWHDFVVVETVDYQPHEQGMFPPPTTPEQVGSRILLQARLEQGEQQAVSVLFISQKTDPVASQNDNTVEMDVDSDDEDKKEDKAKAAMPPPLPPSLDNVLIRPYNPKAKVPAVSQPLTGKDTAWVVSPITGEKVPADKLQEHMRYALLDPRWVEERERSISEKVNKEEVFAPGTSIESSLKHLAERRTDIFGSGDVETAIGQKIGEEERRKPEKITWDGYSSSAAATSRAARENITIEEQIQHIHRMKGLVEEKDRIGPSVISSGGNPVRPNVSNVQAMTSLHSNLAPMPQTSHVSHAMMGNPGGAPGMGAGGGAPFMLPTPPVMLHQQMYGMVPGMGVHDMGLAGYGMSEEPAAKKQKTEENLIAEEEFLKANSGPVTFQVIVPHIPDKPEWNLNGQSLTFTMPLTDTLTAVKSRISEQIGMPAGKQKLQFEGMFVKDSNSLAFYNVPNGATMVLGLKERGGRKK